MKILKMIKEDDKFDKRCARSTYCWEIKGTINREIYCVHRSKDSVLLTCQFSPNWSINSMQDFL